MAKEIKRTIEIPEGMEVEIKLTEIVVKKNGKQMNKKIPFSKKITVTKEGSVIKIASKTPTKRESALAGTIEAHIANAIAGLEKEYVYKLEICNVHFPMNVKIDNNKIIIKNFLGEKQDRVANILKDVEASLKGNIIELKSFDKDSVGQSAANIEMATKVRNRDRRVFQDGIYITEKGDKII